MVTYPVVVYKDEESDYGTVVPDLPGCVSAGASLSIAMEMTNEAVQCHLEGMGQRW
ncbi:MAG: type II toxin-antitoxin system HicB family antitoxin [Gammaproteobacteria bacterium]|nr:type II toxin-antitoxin system HicB family antitoxin [Gammaproteobacteria bacterium]